ncbi:uncharacterized protein LOC135821873 [Sycon ciliatum]|uniref:uncharacterized protein LOC135821873 n=1 Tax=Sycon ciliatum TaxID=27933 RepID=UPI0031F6431C
MADADTDGQIPTTSSKHTWSQFPTNVDSPPNEFARDDLGLSYTLLGSSNSPQDNRAPSSYYSISAQSVPDPDCLLHNDVDLWSNDPKPRVKVKRTVKERIEMFEETLATATPPNSIMSEYWHGDIRGGSAPPLSLNRHRNNAAFPAKAALKKGSVASALLPALTGGSATPIATGVVSKSTASKEKSGVAANMRRSMRRRTPQASKDGGDPSAPARVNGSHGRSGAAGKKPANYSSVQELASEIQNARSRLRATKTLLDLKLSEECGGGGGEQKPASSPLSRECATNVDLMARSRLRAAQVSTDSMLPEKDGGGGDRGAASAPTSLRRAEWIGVDARQGGSASTAQAPSHVKRTAESGASSVSTLSPHTSLQREESASGESVAERQPGTSQTSANIKRLDGGNRDDTTSVNTSVASRGGETEHEESKTRENQHVAETSLGSKHAKAVSGEGQTLAPAEHIALPKQDPLYVDFTARGRGHARKAVSNVGPIGESAGSDENATHTRAAQDRRHSTGEAKPRPVVTSTASSTAQLKQKFERLAIDGIEQQKRKQQQAPPPMRRLATIRVQSNSGTNTSKLLTRGGGGEAADTAPRSHSSTATFRRSRESTTSRTSTVSKGSSGSSDGGSGSTRSSFTSRTGFFRLRSSGSERITRQQCKALMSGSYSSSFSPSPGADTATQLKSPVMRVKSAELRTSIPEQGDYRDKCSNSPRALLQRLASADSPSNSPIISMLDDDGGVEIAL